MEILDGSILKDGKAYEIRRLTVQVMTNELSPEKGNYLVDWFMIESDAPKAVSDEALCLLANRFRCMAFGSEERGAEPIVSAWTGVPSCRVDTLFTF